MLTQTDLNRLKIFVHIFEEESIVGAAASLHITRSAVSQQLKKCEEEVGCTLFIRQHTTLIPTGAARQLYQLVAPLLRDLDKGLRELRAGSSEPAGLLRIGAPLEFGKTQIPAAIGSYRQSFPRVTFDLTLGPPDRLMALVKTGELDFAFIDLFLTERDSLGDSPVYATRPVFEEEVVLICSTEYYDTKMSGDSSFNNLRKMEYITYQQNNLVLYTWFQHHHRKSAPSLSIVLTVDSVRAVVAAVQAHLGLGVVPSHVVGKQLDAGEIVVISSARANIVNTISLLQLQDKRPTLTEKSFLNHFHTFMETTPHFERADRRQHVSKS